MTLVACRYIFDSAKVQKKSDIKVKKGKNNKNIEMYYNGSKKLKKTFQIRIWKAL